MSLTISIGIFGKVSAGKSTLLNAITGLGLSVMGRTRTTMQPHVYDTALPILDEKKIQAAVAKVDAMYANKTELKVEPHHIGFKTPSMFDLPQGVHLRIYDTPGLNDKNTRGGYFKYVESIIHDIDVCIIVIDHTNGMSASDDHDVVGRVFEMFGKSKRTFKHVLFVLNKVDDPDDEETAAAVEQCKLSIETIVGNDHSAHDVKYEVLAMSALNYYITQHLTAHGGKCDNLHPRLKKVIANKLFSYRHAKQAYGKGIEFFTHKINEELKADDAKHDTKYDFGGSAGMFEQAIKKYTSADSSLHLFRDKLAYRVANHNISVYDLLAFKRTYHYNNIDASILATYIMVHKASSLCLRGIMLTCRNDTVAIELVRRACVDVLRTEYTAIKREFEDVKYVDDDLYPKVKAKSYFMRGQTHEVCNAFNAQFDDVMFSFEVIADALASSGRIEAPPILFSDVEKYVCYEKLFIELMNYV